MWVTSDGVRRCWLQLAVRADINGGRQLSGRGVGRRQRRRQPSELTDIQRTRTGEPVSK